MGRAAEGQARSGGADSKERAEPNQAGGKGWIEVPALYKHRNDKIM